MPSMSAITCASARQETTQIVSPPPSVEEIVIEDEAGPSFTPPPCRRIQVSREKRPLHFFLTLSKKFLLTDKMVELSGLGLAVTTVVTVAEILREQNLVEVRGMFLMH